jgi:hypothetical protein
MTISIFRQKGALLLYMTYIAIMRLSIVGFITNNWITLKIQELKCLTIKCTQSSTYEHDLIKYEVYWALLGQKMWFFRLHWIKKEGRGWYCPSSPITFYR